MIRYFIKLERKIMATIAPTINLKRKIKSFFLKNSVKVSNELALFDLKIRRRIQDKKHIILALLILFRIEKTRSYILKIKRKVPPETPGIIFAVPRQNPIRSSLINDDCSLCFLMDLLLGLLIPSMLTNQFHKSTCAEVCCIYSVFGLFKPYQLLGKIITHGHYKPSTG